jgi:Fe-S-cluster-containing hydrogenase component 2
MEQPVCVDVCPTRALKLVDTDEFEGVYKEKRRKAAETAVSAGGADGFVIMDLET